jgi:hypothetical protein
LSAVFGLFLLLSHLYIDLSRVVTLAPDPPFGNRFLARPSINPPWLQESPQLPAIEILPRFRMAPANQQGADIIRLELWARRNLPPNSVIAVSYFNDAFLISGLKNPLMFDDRLDPLQVFMEGKVDYVFLAEAYPFYSNWALKAMKAQPGRFTEVQRIPGTRTAVYKFNHENP